MFEFMQDIDNYESRKVDRTELKNGLIVSTAWSSDEGYETAIIDTNGVHPVERYGSDESDKEDAQKAHEKWKEFAKDGIGKSVIKLGWLGGLVDSEAITLE